MKKFFSIFILLIFILTTNGFAVSVNYCCGRIRSVSLTGKASQKNSCTQMKAMPNCCRHENKYIKLTVHTLTSVPTIIHTRFAQSIALLFNYHCTLQTGASPFFISPINCSPSPPGKLYAYLLHCSILV